MEMFDQGRDQLRDATQGQEVGGTLPFINQGIATLGGAPVDAYNMLMRGLGGYEVSGGSETITSGMQGLGIGVAEPGQQPQSAGEYVGRGVGEAAGMLIPGGAIARGMQGARGAMTSGIGQSIMAPFTQAPVRATATELSAGAGAGLGGMVAEGQDPENPASRVIGELIGGIAGGLGPSAAVRGGRAIAERAPITGQAIRAIRGAIVPFTESGARVRASNRIRGLAADPERAAQRMTEDNVGALSPSQQSGEERLMALEQAVRDTDATIDEQFKRQTSESVRRLTDELRAPARGATPDDTRAFIGQRLNYLTDLMQTRMAQAGERAQERISALEPQRRGAESAAIVRDEIESAHAAARAQERQIWQSIPPEAEAPTEATRRAYQDLTERLGQAQRRNIPDVARELLSGESNRALRDTESVKELRGLYTELGEIGAEARAAPGGGTKVHAVDTLRDAILEDLDNAVANGEQVNQLLTDARAFSRQVNERFRRGEVGRILRSDRQGGPSVGRTETLEGLTRTGPGAAVRDEEIAAAVEGSEDAAAATRDFLRARFRDATVRDGEFSPQRAETFVRSNADLLERYPDLRDQMRDAEQAQRLARSVRDRAESRLRRIQDPAQSRAAEFLGAPMEREFETLLRPGQRDPRKMAQELRRQVQKDDTGQALRGLQGGFLDYLARGAAGRNVDDEGRAVLSGRVLRNMLQDRRTRAVATELFSNDQLKRIERVAEAFRNVETATGRLPSVGDIMDDTPNSVISLAARTLAARSGARMGQGASGASLLTANFASQRMRQFLNSLTNDKAEALIRDAITGNRALYRDLLRGVDTKQDARQVERRLLEWLEGYAGTQIGAAMEEDDRNAP